MSTNPKADFLIRCPQCDAPSNSIKILRFPIIVFLIIYFHVFTRRIAACPSCQRRNIGIYALINLPTMNVLWPFVYLPVIAFYVVCTFIPGHSRDVHEMLHLRK